VKVAELVGFEIQMQVSGTWETVERFTPAELTDAKAQFSATRPDHKSDGIRLIEERVDDEGVFRTRTLGFRKANAVAEQAPSKAAGAKASKEPPAPAQKTGVATLVKSTARAGKGTGGGTGKPGGRPRLHQSAGKPGVSRLSMTPAQQMKASGSRFSFSDLITYLFSPTRDANGAIPTLQAAATSGKVTGGPVAQLPPPPAPVAKRGDLDVFEDEADLASADLVAADSTVRQFRSFVQTLNGLDTAVEARANPKFIHGISLFTIGALFSIEEQIDIFSKRGKAVVHVCLELFVDLHETIAHFVGSLEKYLQDPDAAGWIRSGSRCFKMYRDADFKGLEREFGESFGVYDKIQETLGGRVKVGILFTDIVNSTAMTGELGDDLAQQVIDHHDTTVEDLARRFGGRKVKHLGDGLMLSFGSAHAMAGCAVAVVDAMKGLHQHPEVPAYQIRCGGHFGEAIRKEDDFFGSTVQLAARVSGSAGNNEARVCALLIDEKKPVFTRFEDCGAATLKGFDQPMLLARYR
jgi:class 3 adenylate cyclase